MWGAFRALFFLGSAGLYLLTTSSCGSSKPIGPARFSVRVEAISSHQCFLWAWSIFFLQLFFSPFAHPLEKKKDAYSHNTNRTHIRIHGIPIYYYFLVFLFYDNCTVAPKAYVLLLLFENLCEWLSNLTFRARLFLRRVTSPGREMASLSPTTGREKVWNFSHASSDSLFFISLVVVYYMMIMAVFSSKSQGRDLGGWVFGKKTGGFACRSGICICLVLQIFFSYRHIYIYTHTHGHTYGQTTHP